MQIYIFKNNEQFGPFDAAQIEDYIKTNVFDINDFAWSEGEPEWIPLSDLLLKQTNIQDVEDVGISPSPAEIQLSQEEEAKILTAEIAEQFLKNSDAVALSEFTTIEDYAACVLATHKGEISLNGLKTLSDAAARLLSKHKGFLSLNGLEFLSDESARAFAYHGGDLRLGIGKGADLSALEGLNDAAAKFIAAEPATARKLLAQHGRLDLKGLTSLSDAAAAALASQKGFLSLSGLKSLSDSSAEALSRHEGFLDLSGLESLSDSSASSLANIFRKGFLWLEGQAEEACKVARSRARERLETATNFANQILSSSESINPKKMQKQILALEKLYDFAGVPKNSREGVIQIKRALAELEIKIAQANEQSQVKAQAQSEARAKEKAHAIAQSEARAKEKAHAIAQAEARAKEKAHAIAQAEVKAKNRSESIKTIFFVSFFIVTPIVGIILLCIGFGNIESNSAVNLILTGFICIALPFGGIFVVAAMSGSSDPQTRNTQVAMWQRQQMMNKLDDIRSEFNDE